MLTIIGFHGTACAFIPHNMLSWHFRGSPVGLPDFHGLPMVLLLGFYGTLIRRRWDFRGTSVVLEWDCVMGTIVFP